MSAIAVTGLNQSYGGSHTLWDVHLAVPAGSRTCLMGRNGMGKTTLLKCIMGLLPATSGVIEFAGTDLLKLPAQGRARLGIGYVPQGREIFSQLTVEENLRIGLGVRTGGARSIPSHIFEQFPVFLDEPTEGIQPNIVHEIGDILLKLNRDAGVTVLLVEQQLRFARRVASRFGILEKGRCVAGGSIDELTDEVVRDHLSV
jgi:urea transport system ATP-binding protein